MGAMAPPVKCLTCRWFAWHTAAVGSDGDCKRRAPTLTSNGNGRGVWPVVSEDDRCGEHELASDWQARLTE